MPKQVMTFAEFKERDGKLEGCIVERIYVDEHDNGKQSKRGMLKLIQNSSGKFKTVQVDPAIYDHAYASADLLVPVFRNGELLKEYTFAEIRDRINTYLSEE